MYLVHNSALVTLNPKPQNPQNKGAYGTTTLPVTDGQAGANRLKAVQRLGFARRLPKGRLGLLLRVATC